MSGLLLDTNIVLPVIDESMTRLPRAVAQIVAAPDTALYVSVASLWEIAIKSGTGKLKLTPALPTLPSLLVGLGMALLRIEEAHVLHVLSPEPDTRDPFDRLLLAQCAVEGMQLVTRDQALASHPLAWRPD